MKDCLIKERTAKWDINEFLSDINHIIKRKKYFITETNDVPIVSTICRCKYKSGYIENNDGRNKS